VFSRRFPRSLVLVALAVLAGHVFTVVFLGRSTFGSLIGNSLQIFCSFLAAAMCFRAARNSSGFTQSFWTMIGFATGVWGVADIGWTYYEVVLYREPPPGSIIRFLFDTHGMFFVMALFLNQEKTTAEVESEEMLDFVQVGILFFLIYFGMYYVPSFNLGPHSAVRREVIVADWEDAGIICLAVLQWLRGRLPEVRRLYGGLALYFLIYTFGAIIAEPLLGQDELPTGNWYDLAWSIPLLFGAFWAATWEPYVQRRPFQEKRDKSLADIVITNGMYAFLPLAILFLVSQLGPGWPFIRFGLLGVSFACYALRIALSEFQQSKSQETVRRQTMAMDTAVDGIALLDPEGKHVYANSAFARMLGFESPNQIVGQPWRVVFGHQDVDRLEPDVRLSLARTQRWSSPLRIKRPDGSSIAADFTINAMPDGGTVCICRDLSERHQVERARDEAEAKYRALVEQVNAITYIAEIGVDGQWYFVSPQVETILGYSVDEWLGMSKDWCSIVHPDDLPGVIEAEAASARGLPFQAEYRAKRKDGREIWLNDTGVVIQGSDSHPMMEGIIVDVTERKQLETQLQQSRKMEAVGRLAGGIAHDFNNLLTVITGYTDLALSRSSVPLELRTDIERIENAAGRAAALVRQLLAFSRKQVLQPKILDLNAIVVNMDKLLRRLMDDNIEMTTKVSEKLGKVKADPAQIEQVLMNLVVNARDAMPKGGRIVIETNDVELNAEYATEHVTVKPGLYVMLAVSDSGIGMSPETVAHIFEPFFTTKESGHGTGLGLSTVYGIVKQSGGYIWVYSEPGKGSTFKVYLPRVEGMEEMPTKILAPPAEDRGTETILLVEDEEPVRELIQTILSGRGYTVIVADSPWQAEDIAEHFSADIHLLLTDVVMPRTSGRELAASILAKRPHIRVLYMSGYTENVVTSGGLLEEGLAFLQKPFSPSALLHKIREVLSHTSAI
jgi:two-component system, cell cycle sensor histidine kinase and response regulator CckA